MHKIKENKMAEKIFNIKKILNQIKKIKKSNTEDKMDQLEQILIRNLNNQKRNGIKEGISRGITIGLSQKTIYIIKRMLRMKFAEETIKDATGASDEQIKQAKKEMEID